MLLWEETAKLKSLHQWMLSDFSKALGSVGQKTDPSRGAEGRVDDLIPGLSSSGQLLETLDGRLCA